MKVVVVGGWTPSLINFRGPLLKAMVDRGHEVWGMAAEEDPDIIRQLGEIGVKFRSIPLQRTGLNPKADIEARRVMEEYFREIKPDKVLCYTIKPVIYGTLAAKAAGVPERYAMITGLGGAFEPGGLKQKLITHIAKTLYRKALRHVDRIIVQNPDDQADIVRLGLATDDQFRMINGSGVDTAKFDVKPLPEGPPHFLMIARVLVEKGVREYASAARIVKAKHPEAKFTLVGWTESNPSAIQKEEVEGWVSEGILDWPGATKDVRPYIEACIVYCLPSYREGTPRTVLEAMAMGRPIITSDAPGCRETIVDGEQGYLVPVRDVKALAARMSQLAEDRSLAEKFAKAARERAEEKYDVHKVNASVLEIMKL